MKQKLTLLLIALFTAMGAWATDVTVIDKAHDATTYGSLSGTTFTTNAASGMAGVTIEGIKGTTATSFAYGACLSLTSTDSGTITMTAPSGYIITGYSLTARSNTYRVPYTLTPSAGGSAVETLTGGVTLTASGLDAQTASFTYSASESNSFYIPSMTLTILSATAEVINVTYELYESDGTTLVSSVVKEQEENSEIEVPSSLTAPTYYDYATTGTIGSSDCTIKVTRTLKSGYVISLDGLSNSKCYNIRNNRGTWAVGSGATVVNSTVELNLAFSASDTKQQFAFITYEGNVYLYSVGEHKFAYVDGTKLSLTADVTSAVAASPVTFQNSTNATFMYSEPIIVTVNGSHFGISTGFSPDVYKYQSQGDGGNCAYIIEAGSFDATSALEALGEYFHPSYVTYIVKDASENTLYTSDPVVTRRGTTITTLPAEYQLTNFYTYNTVDVTINASGNTNVEFVATPKAEPLVKYTADTTNPYYYNLNIRSKYLVYNSNATGEVTLQDTSEPFNANASWAFIGEPYAGFKVINKTKGTGYFLTYTSVVTERHSTNNVQFVAEADFTNQYWLVDNNNGGFCLRMKANPNIYFHHDNGNNYLRTCSTTEWSAVHNDAGSTIVASTDEDVLFALYDAMRAYVYGEGLGQYTATGKTAAEVQQTIAEVGQVITNETTTEYADAYNELNHLKNISTLNLPSTGFYRIQGATSGKYLAAGLASNNKFNMTDATDATTIFYFDGTKLTNFGSGMCNGVDGSNWAWVVGTSASTVTFHDGHTSGGYGIQTANAYFYDNGDNSNSADRGTSVDMTSGNERYRKWYLTEITTLPVTISAAGYATLYAPVALTIPSGVTAYTGVINGEWLTTTEITGDKIPAETAVVLKAAAGSYDFDVTTAEDLNVANDLKGSIGGKAAAGNMYVLANDADDGVGFYNATSGNVAGFKAYLEVGAGVKGFALKFDDDATAIESIQNSKFKIQNDEVIFNLAGQRIMKAQKGINIVNGKKVLK